MLKNFWIYCSLIGGTMLSQHSLHASNNAITVAWEGPPRTLDPRYAIDANSQYLMDLIHCSLIGFDSDGGIKAQLAKKWEWTSDKSIKIYLKKGIKYSNNQIVTSSDVKKVYEFFLTKDLPKPTPLAGAYKNIESIQNPSSDLVIFNLKEPDATFLSNLIIGIIPSDQVSPNIIDETSALPSCGPYLLTSKNVSQMKLEKNPHFNLSQPAHHDILIKFVKEESTRFAKLRKGEVDLVQNSLNRDKLLKVAKKYKNLKIERKAGLKTSYLGFNMKDPILKDVKVRQAISHAIHKELIIKYLLNGFAVPANTMLTPNDRYRDKSIKAPEYSPTLANKILDEAGYKKKNNFRFELTYKITQNATSINIAKAIASDLKRIGIKVKVQPLEWGRFKADVEQGKVQLWSLAWIGFKDPDIYRYAFATESFSPNGGNRGSYSNPELDALLTKAKITADFSQRKEIYNKVQTLVANELPYVFLWHEENFAVMSESIEGFEIYADGRYSSLKDTLKK